VQISPSKNVNEVWLYWWHYQRIPTFSWWAPQKKCYLVWTWVWVSKNKIIKPFWGYHRIKSGERGTNLQLKTWGFPWNSCKRRKWNSEERRGHQLWISESSQDLFSFHWKLLILPFHVLTLWFLSCWHDHSSRTTIYSIPSLD